VATKQVPSELAECKAFWEWSQLNPQIKDYLIKNTNEGPRSAHYGCTLRKIGLRPGLPDYHLPISNMKYHGLWIEMKRINSQKHQKDEHQTSWLDRLNLIGHYATYAYGWYDASKIVTAYLDNRL
jgi:hypothetical protein